MERRRRRGRLIHGSHFWGTTTTAQHAADQGLGAMTAQGPGRRLDTVGRLRQDHADRALRAEHDEEYQNTVELQHACTGPSLLLTACFAASRRRREVK